MKKSISLFILLWLTLNSIGQNKLIKNGLSPKRLANLEKLMLEHADSGLVGSAVGLIARNGEVLFLKAVGNMGKDVPMQINALTRLASITKTITAAAVMILYEEGKISLNDPIANYLPEYASLKVAVKSNDGTTNLEKANKFITIYDLLTHQGGIASGGKAFYDVWDKAKNLREFSKLIAEIPLESQPGSVFKYGSYGSSYELLAAIVEIVSQQSFKNFLNQRIFSPLNMKDTYFRVPKSKRNRLSAQYKEKGYRNLTVFKKLGEEEKPTKFYSGGGGLRSTVMDYFKFAQMLLNKGQLNGIRILSPKSVELMTINHMKYKAWGNNYGWGFGAEVRIGLKNGELGNVGAYGWNGGTGTKYIVDPKEKLIAIIFIPSTPRSIGANRLRNLFISGAYQAIINP